MKRNLHIWAFLFAMFVPSGCTGSSSGGDSTEDDDTAAEDIASEDGETDDSAGEADQQADESADQAADTGDESSDSEEPDGDDDTGSEVPRAESLATAGVEGVDIDDVYWDPTAYPDAYPESGSGHFRRVFAPACEDGTTPDSRECETGEPIRCADGTRPVAYTRPGSTNNWLIRIQNGGISCEASYGESDRNVLERNCWSVYQYSDERHALTSRGSNARGSLEGIYRDDEANPFNDFNMVFLDKCVGDRNLGDATFEDYHYRNTTDPRNPVVEYQGPVYFHGFRIVKALLRAAHDSSETNTLDLVVFQTHSNGTNGQYMYIDRLADYVRELNPSAEVRGIATSNFRPNLELEATADDDGNVHWEQMYENLGNHADLSFHIRASEDSLANGMWASPWIYHPGGLEYERNSGWGTIDDTPTIDASCLAAHPDDSAPCLDHMHVLFNHISTPIFLVPQLQDPAINNSQHRFTLRFDRSADCDEGDTCCHDENYYDDVPCDADPSEPFLTTQKASYDLLDFARRNLELARALRERHATHSEMRPDCTGSPCDDSDLPSPRFGAFFDDIENHESVHDTDKSMSIIEGRMLESYLYDWVINDTDTFCVDSSLEGVRTSGTAPAWALCPDE